MKNCRYFYYFGDSDSISVFQEEEIPQESLNDNTWGFKIFSDNSWAQEYPNDKNWDAKTYSRPLSIGFKSGKLITVTYDGVK